MSRAGPSRSRLKAPKRPNQVTQILLIIFAAKIVNTAVPTIERDVGNVARDAIGDIFNPTIPLIKTVIGGAVKENT